MIATSSFNLNTISVHLHSVNYRAIRFVVNFSLLSIFFHKLRLLPLNSSYKKNTRRVYCEPVGFTFSRTVTELLMKTERANTSAVQEPILTAHYNSHNSEEKQSVE